MSSLPFIYVLSWIIPLHNFFRGCSSTSHPALKRSTKSQGVVTTSCYGVHFGVLSLRSPYFSPQTALTKASGNLYRGIGFRPFRCIPQKQTLLDPRDLNTFSMPQHSIDIADQFRQVNRVDDANMIELFQSPLIYRWVLQEDYSS